MAYMCKLHPQFECDACGECCKEEEAEDTEDEENE